MKIMECVPNFSEGRNVKIVKSIVAEAQKTKDVKILDFSMDEDHNRSVLTLIGKPGPLEEAVLASCTRAVALIDMRFQKGVHPRIGAVDVVPFIPFGDSTMEEAIEAAHRFGKRFGNECGVSVYFYGKAALIPERKSLAMVRKGQYEALSTKITDPKWCPDTGSCDFNPTSGATAVGARKPLVAYNVNLGTDNLEAARSIACKIRESSGGFKNVMAMGVPLKSRNLVQVSMNLTDHEVTSMKTVFDAISREAKLRDIEVVESELIGLIPEAALEGTSPAYFKFIDFGPERIIEHHIEA